MGYAHRLRWFDYAHHRCGQERKAKFQLRIHLRRSGYGGQVIADFRGWGG